MHPFDFSDYWTPDFNTIPDFVSKYHRDEESININDWSKNTHKNENTDIRQIYYDTDREAYICPYCGEILTTNPSKQRACPHCQQIAQPY